MLLQSPPFSKAASCLLGATILYQNDSIKQVIFP